MYKTDHFWKQSLSIGGGKICFIYTTEHYTVTEKNEVGYVYSCGNYKWTAEWKQVTKQHVTLEKEIVRAYLLIYTKTGLKRDHT